MSKTDPIRLIVAQLSRFPGIGERTARRLAYWLIRQDPKVAREIGAAIASLPDVMRRCERCFNLSSEPLCTFGIQTVEKKQYLCRRETRHTFDRVDRVNFRGLTMS